MTRTVRGAHRSGYCLGVKESLRLPSESRWPLPTRRLLAKRASTWACRLRRACKKAALTRVALQQHEHVCSDGAQQPEGQATLSDARQSGNGIDDGMGTDFHAQRRLQLRERTGGSR